MTPARQTIALSMVFILFAAALTLAATWSYGIGLNHDSTVYLDAARELAHNGRYYAYNYASGEPLPVIGYPPLYSAVLAALLKLTGNLEFTARCLNVVCLLVTATLAGMLAGGGPRFIHSVALGAAVTVAFSVDLFALNIMALSEPLFLALLVAAWAMLDHGLRKGKLPSIAAAGLFFAAAWLTRYAGMAALAAGALALALHPAFAPRRRALALAILLAIGLLPPALWSLHNYNVAGTATGRALAWHPVSFGHLRMGAGVVSKWLLPQVIPPVPRALLFLLLVAVTAAIVRRVIQAGNLSLRPATIHGFAVRRPAVFIATVFAVIYVPFLLVAISVIDAHTPLDHRLLLPLFLALVIILWSIGGRLTDAVTAKSPQLHIVLLIFAVFIVGMSCTRLLPTYAETVNHGTGLGFARWRNSAIIDAVSKLPADAPIYANGQDIIYALTGRHAVYLPYRLNPNTQAAYDPAPAIAVMTGTLRREHGYLVFLDEVNWRHYLVTADEIRRQTPLATFLAIPGEGIIYRVSDTTGMQ